MPKKTITAPLRGFVRSEIVKAFEENGFARPREIARMVVTAHPEDVELAGKRLAEDAITDMARTELKNSTRQHGVDTQLRLPIVPTSLVEQLPAAISIPSEDESAEDKVVYKPLSKATLEEIEAHLRLLATQISADRKRHQALKELRDLAVAAGARTQSVVMEVLGRLETPPFGGKKHSRPQLPATLPQVPTRPFTQGVRS